MAQPRWTFGNGLDAHRPSHVNVVTVHQSEDGQFYMALGFQLGAVPPEEKAVYDVHAQSWTQMSPSMVKQMHQVLGEVIDRHEQRFGVIQTPAQRVTNFVDGLLTRQQQPPTAPSDKPPG